MQNYVSQQIDHYRIIEQLGQGGMAIIYKAYDTRLERDVAIKVIRTTAIPAQQHERLLKRFEREAKAQAQFKHPNIVPIFDYGIHEGSPYLAMAYVPGGTLKDRLQGPMDYHQAVEWILPIADALQYAHELGIVHRDVKPSNILINQDNQPILTDFGIAKVLDSQESTLTGTGMGVGTPDYMAPEQWKGQSTEASDQYALGVVLYELLTGQKPYAAETPVAIALKQMNDPLTRPSTLAPGIPEQVEKVLFKALAKDPQDRYPNLTAFQQALADAAGMKVETRKTEKRTDVEKPTSSVKTKKKHVWLWAVASVIIVAAAVIGFLGFKRGWDSLLVQFGINQNPRIEKVITVTQATQAPLMEVAVSSTPEPTEVISKASTVTPTQMPQYLINFLRDDAIWQYDLFNEETEKIMDIEAHDSDYWDSPYGLDFYSYLWDPTGRYLVYAPRSAAQPMTSPIFGSIHIYKGLILYDTQMHTELKLIDKDSYHRLIEWSPNSQYIFFYSEYEGLPGYYIYDINNEQIYAVIHLSEPMYAQSIEWDEENSETSFCLSKGYQHSCKIYNFQQDQLENVPDRYSYNADEDPLTIFWNEFYEEEMEVRPSVQIDDSRYAVFWQYQSQNEGGVVIVNINDRDLVSLDGPDYQNAYNYYLAYHDDDITVFTEYFNPCFHIFQNNTFDLISKYCFTTASNPDDEVQKSQDGKFLFIFTEDQIHYLNLESYKLNSIISFGLFQAPKLISK